MAENQKTIVNMPNEVFAEKVNGAIDKGRKNAKRKVEKVKADDEYIAGSTPEPDRPKFNPPPSAEMWAEMLRVWDKYQYADYKRKRRQDERKQFVDFLKKTGAVFVAVFISMAIWHLIGA